MNNMLTISAILGIAFGLFLSLAQPDNAEDELRKCLAEVSASISETPVQEFSEAHAICFNTKPKDL